ncbi:GEVED domain-containing protein [Nonomuraea sp. NPDC002799]
MIGSTRVASAEVSPADPAANADEYLVPANAKTTAGFIDRYEDFAVEPDDWSDVALLTFTFSRPVRDPHLHVFGTGGSSGDVEDRDDYWAAVHLVGGTPATPAFSPVAGFPGYRVSARSIEPDRVRLTESTTCGVVYTCGTVKVNGTVRSFTVKLAAHDVHHGHGGPTPELWAAFKLSLTEDGSDAPASYGPAAHAITDSSLGRSVSADHTDTVSARPRGLPTGTDDDDAVSTARARVATRGRFCTLSVPVRAGSPSNVTGWIDFDRDGRFDTGERATTQIPEGATTARLSWFAPQRLRNGPAWMRLRMTARSETTASATGWADSGEVEDHRVHLVQVPPRTPADTPSPMFAHPPRGEGYGPAPTGGDHRF